MPHTAAFISVKAVDGVNAREFSSGSRAAVPITASTRRVHLSNRTRRLVACASGSGQERPLARVAAVTVTFQFVFANGFTILRALSIKSCATGLSVRFFSVTIPTGLG